MTGQPVTVIARWPSANPLSAIPLLGRALTVSRPGTSLGRRAVQLKPYRLPAAQTTARGADAAGRNMYVVREHDGSRDTVAVFIEDPDAEPDVDAKGAQNQQDRPGGGDKAMSHTRWTYCSLGPPPADAPGGSAPTATAALFDTFIQRALFPPPQLGGGTQPGQAREGAAGAAASNGANGSRSRPPQPRYWQPRAQVVSIEGFVFALTSQSGLDNGVGATGAAGGAGSYLVGAAPDWIIKVGSVGLKGGSASGMTRGCIVEATYLPVPYLPAGSTFARDFVLSLFPAAAVRNGEIELVEPSETEFCEAGLLDWPDPARGEETGEWEWQNKHTFFTYVDRFKKEGIL
ncbi:hypothetical protein JCM8202_004824 [Rhodotorula sphaerocarpa]